MMVVSADMQNALILLLSCVVAILAAGVALASRRSG
jgi:hypothetical protein